ncbi:periplasmic phosphate-binding protein [Chloropicon primus]|uniref:Periplasmic phosphate-binding protein n=1 Tax=Chloropicon primus TaxID=1764295 RepID=A0A5B8MTX5_9CHLO|nr:periplasmic phosphate-binding protein [Chloropicon primus]|eukprot:QDZ23841.1 periplasmic phosphate-binding protein [Chloropicon primus]
MDLLEERTRMPIRATYRAVGSGTGQAEFVGDANNAHTAYNHFGSGDVPMTADNYKSLGDNGRTMLHVPFALGAVSFFHSIPGLDMAHRRLNLTACLLSKVMQREITTWDDPEILVENPNMLEFSPDVAGKDIKVVHRALGSSSTSGATHYLHDACPTDWKLGYGKTVAWPAGTVSAQGSGGVASYLSSNEYAISYVDSGFGHSANLKEIQLQNKAGVFLNSLEANISSIAAEALKENILPSTPDADWSAVNLYNLDGADTWPITSFSYFYIDRDVTSLGESGALLKAFLEFVMSEAGQGMLSEFGFSPLPADLLAYNEETLGNVLTVDPAAAQWLLETKAKTQKYLGAGSYVLSEKRRSYGEYQRTVFASQLASLEFTMDGMMKDHAQLVAHNESLAALEKELEARKQEDGEMATSLAVLREQVLKHTHSKLEGGAELNEVRDVAIAGICLTFLVVFPLAVFNLVSIRRIKALNGLVLERNVGMTKLEGAGQV